MADLWYRLRAGHFRVSTVGFVDLVQTRAGISCG